MKNNSLANWGWLKLVITIIFVQLAGFIGSLYTTPSIDSWFNLLQKPFLSPPNWVFAPVWTILFLMMAISAWLIWQRGLGKKERVALGIFLLQLGLNVLWSIIFFGWHNLGLAVLEIIALWLSILWTIKSFNRLSPLAARLLWPYLAWVSFASYLTIAFWWLN